MKAQNELAHMEGPMIDLDYLGRFCNEDRTRMERYVKMYLQGAPDMFEELLTKAEAGDAEGLAVAAHNLRPQVNYMGAQRIFDLLTRIESESRTSGSDACKALVVECLVSNVKVLDELQAWLAQSP